MNLKSILILIVSAAAFCAVADPCPMCPQSTNGWYSAGPCPHMFTGRVTKATVHATPSADFLLTHLARQYSNDMRTVTGRVKWHGKPVRQEIDATNRMCKIERYADGTVHVEPFRPPKPRGVVTNKAAIAARRAAIQARRNVLPGLKDAQLKAHDAKHSQSNVTVNINIGGK
ncbi:MAG: hypothetical protein IJV91_08345 [Kiritimatiellae bacterium]|nr:hypothetical protein [Kiritimatiellia bacterium]